MDILVGEILDTEVLNLHLRNILAGADPLFPGDDKNSDAQASRPHPHSPVLVLVVRLLTAPHTVPWELGALMSWAGLAPASPP